MRVVPALHGWHWLRDGLKLFASAPLTWMLLVLSYWLVIALVGVLPLIGAFIGVVLMPAFGASFMNIGRTAERGTIATPLLLFSGLRTRQIDMLLLGGIYLVACILVLSTTSLVDGGEFAQFLVAGRAPTTRDLNDLVEKGALIRTGERRYARYHLASTIQPLLLGSESTLNPE